MDTLSRILKKTDFLGKRHSPTFKTQTSVHTCFGGLLSIIFCITVSVGVFFLGRELYERKTPISNLSESREDINEVNLEDIQPIFAIFDDTGKVLTSDTEFLDSFSVSVALLSPESSEDGSFNLKQIGIPLIKCSESLLSDSSYDLLMSNQVSIETYLCMDMDQAAYRNEEKPTKPFVIRNTSSSVGGSSLVFDISQKGLQEGNYLEGFNLHVITKTSYLDITNYGSPVKYAAEEIHQKVIPLEERELFIRYKVNELKTDAGYIFSTEETQYYFSLDSTFKEREKYSKTRKTVTRVLFDVSMMRNVMNRKYLKLQELIASTGGFIKAMTIILGLILKVYSEVTLFNSVNKEKYRIEGKTYIITKNETNANNFIHEKTFSPVLNKSPINTKHVGFCRYLRALLPFSKDYALQNEIEDTFAYFDVLTTIKVVSKIEILERNFKELLKKNISK